MSPRRARGGNSAIEAALAFPVLLVILFALLDWSWYLFQWLTVVRSAHSGTRLAAGVAPEQDPEGVADGAVADWLQAYGIPPESANVASELNDDVLTVTVTVGFEPLVGVIPTPDRLHARAETAWYGELFEGT